MSKTYQVYDTQAPELITKTELAKRLKVATRTVDLWVGQGIITKIKINSSARFDWNDVLSELKNRKEAK